MGDNGPNLCRRYRPPAPPASIAWGLESTAMVGAAANATAYGVPITAAMPIRSSRSRYRPRYEPLQRDVGDDVDDEVTMMGSSRELRWSLVYPSCPIQRERRITRSGYFYLSLFHYGDSRQLTVMRERGVGSRKMDDG